MLFIDTLPWQPYNDSQFKYMVMLGRIQSSQDYASGEYHMNGKILWNIQTLLNIPALCNNSPHTLRCLLQFDEC